MYATLSTWIWGAGIVLQAALMVVLLVRGVARLLPVFTVLIGFYLARSLVLFAISGYISRTALGSLYNGLSLADILFQIAVAAEMTRRLMRQRGGWTLARSGFLAGLASLAIAGGWAAGVLWATRGRASVDRGQMALAAFFVLFFAWAAWQRIYGAARREAEGFALYSVASLVSQVERYRATVMRDAAMYIGWSYALGLLYLAVLGFWIMRMRLDDRSALRGNSQVGTMREPRLTPEEG